MRALGTLCVVIAGVFFVAAACSVVGFLAGGFEFIDGGAPEAIMAYVPVGLALGLVGTLAFIGGQRLRQP